MLTLTSGLIRGETPQTVAGRMLNLKFILIGRKTLSAAVLVVVNRNCSNVRSSVTFGSLLLHTPGTCKNVLHPALTAYQQVDDLPGR